LCRRADPLLRLGERTFKLGESFRINDHVYSPLETRATNACRRYLDFGSVPRDTAYRQSSAVKSFSCRMLRSHVTK
jgi:hypothetical protein